MYRTNTAILKKLALKSLNNWVKEDYASRDYVEPLEDTKDAKVDKDAKKQNNIESF
jgi:hypothetical protein